MKKLVPIIIVIAVGATAYLLWQKSSQTTFLVVEATPEIPVAKIENAELLKRIQVASTQSLEGPENLEGLAELSRLYHANGFTNKAWQCYATLVAVEPDNPRWPYQFGRILAGYGQLEEATPLFEKAAKLAPDYAPTHFRLGDTLFKQNRFDEAEAAYRDILDGDSGNAYALVGLARIAIAAEDWATAREHLESAVRNTNYQIGADLLGDVYEKLGLESKESLILQNSSWGSYADIPDPWSLALMDDCYDDYQISVTGGWVAHQGDKRTGIRYLKRAAELAPDVFIYQYQIANIYLELGDDKNAEVHFKRCVELQPDFSDAWLALVEIAKRRQSPTQVNRTLDAALRAAPDSPSLNIERANRLTAQNRFSRAIPYFQKSIEVRPYEAVGYIAFAKAYFSQNRMEEGIEQIRLALKQEPNNIIALSSMLFDAILRKDKADADQWFSELRKRSRAQSDEVSKLESMYYKAFGIQAAR